jgi:hypothetical protein
MVENGCQFNKIFPENNTCTEHATVTEVFDEII